MRDIEEILDAERDRIVSEIGRYLSDCRMPSRSAGPGPADATARAAAMVAAFMESVELRRVGPFVGWVEGIARDREGCGWEAGEVLAALDLLESLSLESAQRAGSATAARCERIITPIVTAGREAYGREQAGSRL